MEAQLRHIPRANLTVCVCMCFAKLVWYCVEVSGHGCMQMMKTTTRQARVMRSQDPRQTVTARMSWKTIAVECSAGDSRSRLQPQTRRCGRMRPSACVPSLLVLRANARHPARQAVTRWDQLLFRMLVAWWWKSWRMYLTGL